MSHDRGCFCGKEKWEYSECAAKRGTDCARYEVVRSWESENRKYPKPPKQDHTTDDAVGEEP